MSGRGRNNVGGIDDLDARIAGKASCVEGQDRTNAVRQHRGYQPRIMRWLTRDVVLNNQAFPNRINGCRIRQKLEHILHPRQFARRNDRRHAKAVLFDRPGGHDPEFNKILRDDMKFATLFQKTLYCLVNDGVQRMVELQGAGENAGIYKHRLNPVWIDALAADRFIRKQGRCPVMALGPFAKLPHPFLRVRLLKVRDRSGGRILLREFEQPLIDAQSAGLRLLLKTRSTVFGDLKRYVHDHSLPSKPYVSVTSVKDKSLAVTNCKLEARAGASKSGDDKNHEDAGSEDGERGRSRRL